MTLVAGVDSSTQSCKVVVVDAATGVTVREGRAPHPEGTEVHPDAWWVALQAAVAAAGGLADVSAIAVGGQQHGMVCLDEDGRVVRPALLWNDTRSADAAADLVRDLGGPQAWADAVGSVPVASFTHTKLRWLADHEPDAARRTAAVCLPHDWLTWRLIGAPGLDGLVTDRGDASGTGYWSAAAGAYREDLFALALGHPAVLPRVLGPAALTGVTSDGLVVAPGSGDNAASALGLGCEPGDVIVSIGTSGVACAVSEVPSADPTGIVAGFADATGRYLPLVCTLNAAQALDGTARLLGIDLEKFSELALSAAAGAGGAVLVPWFQGERTPDRPRATASFHGLTLETWTPATVARAATEGLLCGLADAVDALTDHGAVARRVLLVGGGASSPAVRQIAPTVFGRPVQVPPTDEYVARGAARQAAWVLSGDPEPPAWPLAGVSHFDADPIPKVRARYSEARAKVLDRVD